MTTPGEPMSPTGPLTIRRPDDWHVHLRDGAVLQAVALATARQCGRAIVMPNLTPPITTVDDGPGVSGADPRGSARQPWRSPP